MVRKMVLYLTAALMGMLAAVALSAVFTVTSVTGSGMEPAVKNGENILINKLAYKSFTSEKPQVGDVVAFGSDVHGAVSYTHLQDTGHTEERQVQCRGEGVA